LKIEKHIKEIEIIMNVGIICDRSYQRSLLIENYYYAIKNLYGNVKCINHVNDLEDVNLLFIGNDHFIPHRDIWWNQRFIDVCNSNNIFVVVIGGEKIFNTHYQHNLEIQKTLEKLKIWHQYVWDVNDAKILNKKIIGYPISKHYGEMFKCNEKENKCLFIGQYEHQVYSERKVVLDNINHYIQTDIMTNLNNSWQEYLNIYCKYRFSLCPISTYSNGIPTRFYEALLTSCIPILQVRDDTLEFYQDEANIPECIFFKDVHELKDKIANHPYDKCVSKLWAEDKMKKLFKEDGIPVPD
jgi:hypothetical protein